MVNPHAAKFNDHRHCGSGDIMPSVAKDKNLRCSIRHYWLSLKDIA